MIKPLKAYASIVLFDCETTGFKPPYDGIIELGALILNTDLTPNKKHSFFVKSPRFIPAKITELTGITQRMSDAGRDDRAVFDVFNAANHEDVIWAAYNTQFDIGFIDALFKKYAPNAPIKASLMDVMAIYKDRFKAPHSLASAIQTLNIPLNNTHRAIDDVMATLEVLKHLHQIKPIDPFINVIGYHPTYGLKGPTYPHVMYAAQHPILGSFETQILHLQGDRHA